MKHWKKHVGLMIIFLLASTLFNYCSAQPPTHNPPDRSILPKTRSVNNLFADLKLLTLNLDKLQVSVGKRSLSDSERETLTELRKRFSTLSSQCNKTLAYDDSRQSNRDKGLSLNE